MDHTVKLKKEASKNYNEKAHGMKSADSLLKIYMLALVVMVVATAAVSLYYSLKNKKDGKITHDMLPDNIVERDLECGDILSIGGINSTCQTLYLTASNGHGVAVNSDTSIILSSDTTTAINSAGTLSLNSDGIIYIGNNNKNQNIYIGDDTGQRNIIIGKMDVVGMSIDKTSHLISFGGLGQFIVDVEGEIKINSINDDIYVGSIGITKDIKIGHNGKETIQIGSTTAIAPTNLLLYSGVSGTTMQSTGNISLSAGLITYIDSVGNILINSSRGGIYIGDDDDTGAITIGNGTSERNIVLGNTTGTTAVSIYSGTGSTTLTSLGTTTINSTGTLTLTSDSDDVSITSTNADILLNADLQTKIDSGGDILINSIGGGIYIGNGAHTGEITIGNGTSARTIVIGNGTDNTGVFIESGTGGVNIGVESVAHPITIGNTTGATAVSIYSGTGSTTITSVGNANINSSAGNINIGDNAAAQSINIGTGAATKNITIGAYQGSTNVEVFAKINVIINAQNSIHIGTDANFGNNILIGHGSLISKNIYIGGKVGTSKVLIRSGTNGTIMSKTVVSIINDTPPTAANYLTGFINTVGMVSLNPPLAWTLPSGEQMVTALDIFVTVGDSFRCFVNNHTDSETITYTAGTNSYLSCNKAVKTQAAGTLAILDFIVTNVGTGSESYSCMLTLDNP